jgi:hypothetical protein
MTTPALRPTPVAVVAPAGVGQFPLAILPANKKWEEFRLILEILEFKTSDLVFGKGSAAVTYKVLRQFIQPAHNAVRAAANGGPSPFRLTCQVPLGYMPVPKWQPQLGEEEQLIYDAFGVPVIDININGKVWTVHEQHIPEAYAHLDKHVSPAAGVLPPAANAAPVPPTADASPVPPAAGVLPPAANAAPVPPTADASPVPPAAGVLPPAANAAPVPPAANAAPVPPVAGVPHVEYHATTNLMLQNFFKEQPPSVIMALATIFNAHYVKMETEDDVSYWVLTGHHSTNSTLQALGLLGPQA